MRIASLYASFNTSHVVIYLREQKAVGGIAMFQYISCYYLSGQKAQKDRGVSEFQYISCCYFSEMKKITEMNMVKFQYISCCYLSY